VAARPFDGKNADLVARDSEVDLVPISLGDTGPRDDDALFGKGADTVLVGPELGDATGAFEFALVIVLLGEGEEELLFSVAIVSMESLE
jgi:hypothetical protein